MKALERVWKGRVRKMKVDEESGLSRPEQSRVTDERYEKGRTPL